jgi:hypothetical protein
MLLDGENGASQKELVYDAGKEIDHEHEQTNPSGLRPAAEDNRGALDLERAADERAALSGDGHQCGPLGPVAESGDRRDAPGVGSQAEGSAAADQSAALAADREEACRFHGESWRSACGQSRSTRRRAALNPGWQ